MGRSPGFSYLELMVALALLAIMTLFISGSFEFGRRVWERTDDFDAYVETQTLRQDLRAWLEAATFRGEKFGEPAIFRGDARGFLYVGVVEREALPLYDLGRISVSMTDGIQVRMEIESPFEELETLEISGPLLAGAEDARLSYFAEGVWREAWRGPGLPDLIRIEAGRDGRAWPPLVVTPGWAVLRSEVEMDAPFEVFGR